MRIPLHLVQSFRGLRAGKVAWLAIVFINVLPGMADESPARWWPTQAFPKAIVRTTSQQDFPEPKLALQMMVQSVAGLAAQAVNEQRGDELVWVYNGAGDLEKWYAKLIAKHRDLETPGAWEPWDLVDRYARKGVIKGYILYRVNKSKDDRNLNCSANVATSMAGLLGGIILDEKLESQAKAHGLKLLMDVRDKTQSWCFQTYQNQFNRRMLCLQDPRIPHSRDLAIAQKTFTAYGSDASIPAAMRWLEPLSPVLGWNDGDEFENTDLSSRFGNIQTATDWCLNLPVLMAGTEHLDLPRLKNFDPRMIDWKDSRSAVSFIGSDGDNVQWCLGNFFGGDKFYWENPSRGKIPFGWSTCFDHLAQLCPQAIGYALDTGTTNDCLIEWGGGYYYPDRFARERTNQWELLAQHASRTWQLMKKTNERIIGFNFFKIDSADARKACAVFAGQTDGLLAILAFQYYPYEGGAGLIFWVKDCHGIEVPVISARYSIWEHANERERAGTPSKIAREIRQSVETSGQIPRYDWVIDHAWSFFKHAPGINENTENMPQESAEEKGGACGYSPVIWCAERLPANIRVINPEELAWRIRMQHNPAQTEKQIHLFQ